MHGPAGSAPPAPAGQATVLVWIDADEAVVVRWNGWSKLDRITSEVPPHHHSTGHVRFDPSGRHGGGGEPQDRIERDRRGHLRAYLAEVAKHIAPDDDVEILGPGTVRDELARLLRNDDLLHGRHRALATAASPRLTDRQLIARLRDRIGEPAPRRRPRRTD